MTPHHSQPKGGSLLSQFGFGRTMGAEPCQDEAGIRADAEAAFRLLDLDGDGDLDYICGVGARSFSIWTTDLEMVWDSGHDFSQYSTHNGQHLVDEMNTRDDNKGIEPEGVKVGEIDGRQYLFVSMERSFGVMIYDITDPNNPSFQQWIQVDGSSNPEDMEFVSADVSPTGTPLLLVANEDSGSVGIWELMLI